MRLKLQKQKCNWKNISTKLKNILAIRNYRESMIKYQISYTKLFVRKFISQFLECFKKENSLEVKEYFLEYNPKMFPEIQG